MTSKATPDVVDKAFAEVRSAYDRLSRLVEDAVPKPVELVKMTIAVPSNNNVFRVGIGWHERDAATIEELDSCMAKFKELYGAWRVEADRVAAANVPLIAHNAQVRARVAEYMRAIGVRDTRQERDTSSRARVPKYITKPAGYVTDIAAIAPVSCPVAAQRTNAENQMRSVQQMYDRRVTVIKEAAKEAEKKQKKAQALRALVAMQIKYGAGEDAEWSDVLDAILAKDKLLALADAMLACRLDWSDGCGAVADRLAEARDLLTDSEWNSIASAIDSFHDDQDGRYFRDCETSYDILFAKVAEENSVLYADYTTTRGNCNAY